MSVTECDCCKAANAEQRCSKCKCAYYCSRECQKKDWPQHKRICQELAQKSAEIEAVDRSMDAQVDVKEKSQHGECAICLDPLNKDPLSLPCKHIFCGPCILEHQRYIGGREITCPLCRSKLPENLFQYVYANASNFVSRARRSPIGSAKRARYCTLARSELESIMECAANAVEIKTLVAELLFMEGRYSEAVSASDAIIADEPQPQVELLLCNLRNSISANLQLEDFPAATEKVKEMYRIITNPAKFLFDTRFMTHKASQCFYGLGKYAEAIEFGKEAIEMNRHYEDVHRCVALSHKALGNYPEAIRIMQRAVRYEAPWDEQHVQRCRDLLAELEEESRKLSEGSSDRVEELPDAAAV